MFVSVSSLKYSLSNSSVSAPFDYDAFFNLKIDEKKKTNNYRVFNSVNRCDSNEASLYCANWSHLSTP